jgi:hypothetical protein
LHLLDERQVLQQADLVYSEGADGLFLIDMGHSTINTLQAAEVVRAAHPDGWLGVNLLGWGVVDAMRRTEEAPIQGLWVDDAEIDERPSSWRVLPHIRDEMHRRWALNHPVEVFGGVAFKYRREVRATHLETVATIAAQVLQVVCTSGPGTGHAADPEKLRLMREGVEGTPARLAVASGVTPDNAREQMEHAHDVLLATGIEDEFGYLSRSGLRRVLAARR